MVPGNIATAEGGNVEPATLIEHLAERLPHFAVPRFIRSMQSLPKTSTGKIKKHELRGNEVGADVWDREAHGIALKRKKLS